MTAYLPRPCCNHTGPAGLKPSRHVPWLCALILLATPTAAEELEVDTEAGNNAVSDISTPRGANDGPHKCF